MSHGHVRGQGARNMPAGGLAGVSGRADHWTVFKGLIPFVWPEGRPDLRMQVVLAFVVLVIAKLVTIAVPILFKEATDWLTQNAPAAGEPGAPEV